MIKKGRKAISFIAGLLAVLTLVPAETAEAVTATSNEANNNVLYWDDSLPLASGDRDYTKDTSWYRLVLEYGSYSTNAIDSEGNHVNTLGGDDNSWPWEIWNNYYKPNDKGNVSSRRPTWLQTPKAKSAGSGTIQREEDYSIYRNGEYSYDGMYSLYIKYAGKSKKTGEDCWYISPCDKYGEREKRLWALDCCLDKLHDNMDMNWDIWWSRSSWSAKDVQASNDMYSIKNGINPVIKLLCPTFEEYASQDHFKYAGMTLNWHNNNDGALLADYKDNNKWIITQNTDGSWAIKSAGYMEWDFSVGEFVKLVKDPAEALANGLAHYARITATQQYANSEIIDFSAASASNDQLVATILYYGWFDKYLDASNGAFGENGINALPYAQMFFLSDFVENVYITGGYVRRGCELIGKTNKAGENLFNTYVSGESKGASLCTSYSMKLENDVTVDQLKKGISDYTKNQIDAYKPAASMGIVTEDSNGKALSLDEIKKTLPIRYVSAWTPDKDSGAFTGLYVGAPLNTVVFNKDNQNITIEEGTTLVLGASDKNDDGGCDEAAYIGTLMADSIRENGAGNFGGTLTIEEGAVLQIDGPTYATLGTKIIVKGSLIVNSGASLSCEDANEYADKRVFEEYAGLELEIDGGSVYVSKGAILDAGYADVTVTNGGSLVNDGVFIQDTHDISNGSECTSYINVKGGSIENGRSGMFISGAEVKYFMRQTLIRKANAGAGLAELVIYNLTDINDSVLGLYSTSPFEDTKNQEYVNLRVYESDDENLIRNTGTAIITGAIKGVYGSENDPAGYVLNSGTLYRGRDAYKADTGILINIGNSSDCHANICINSGKDFYTDPTINQYNELTGLKYSTANVYTDDDAETVAAKNNVYALQVGTGSDETNSIANFTVSYMDKSGKLRSETISPANLEGTYTFVSEWAYCGTGENELGTSKLKNLSSTGGIMSGKSFPKGLEALSNVTYVFQTLYPLDYVESISIVGASSGSWSCTELNVYRVSYLYPLEEYGWRSQDWFVPFTGSLIAETQLTADSNGINSYVFNWDSEALTIGSELYGLNVYEAPDKLESKTDNTGFTYYKVSGDKKPYSTANKEYTFSLSLADADRAGIESYYYTGIDHSLSDLMGSAEELKKLTTGVKIDIELEYLDTHGAVRRISLPYTQSAIEWAYDNCDAGSLEEPLHGLFQQGEDIVFKGVIPDYKTGREVLLSYTDSEGGDSIAITAFSISNPGYTGVSVHEGMLKADFPDTAVSYYCAPEVTGVYLNNDQNMTVSLKAWNGTDSLEPKAKGSRYLVVVQTDDMSLAATTNEMTVSFEYKSLSGLTGSTPVYSLKSLTNDYYGYWLSSAGVDNDCAYLTAVSSGQSLYFVIEISNLYKFTSATFAMPIEENKDADTDQATVDNGDEWQMKSITIYELEELGDRQVLLGKGISLTNVSTNRTYYRDNRYGSRGAISSAKGPLLVGPNQSKTISFEDGKITGEDIGGKNKATRLKELNYEDTKQNFGFNIKRYKYNVDVQVSGSSINSVEDGDCGSKNQFYFQLVFEDEDGKLRTSPCVLSNQQLKGDGFRTATLESFSIYTNDDYGTPVQINVIPDDTSTTSDVFDKLCIDYISVSKTSSTGVNLSWKAENVGWIDIEYKDDEETQEGRSDEEIVRSFELKDAGYSVRIEFGIETAADYEGDKQYVGQMTADITYRDTSGAIKTKYNQDVVDLMADYADRKSDLGDTPVDGTQISLSEFMFKNGYTNRFQVEFDDISSLVRIKLKLTPDDSSEDIVADWKVTKVFARQVYDKGTLTYNIFDEYERQYRTNPQDLTSSSNKKAITVRTASGLQTIQTINFNSGNSIVVNLNDEEIEVEQGVSEGINDAISITAELTDTTGINEGATMPVSIIYKNIYGDAYSVKAELVYDAGSGKFMVPQNNLPKTPDIAMPYKLEIYGSGTLVGKQLEVVTVNQIRDGQVLETFNFVPDTGTRLETNATTIILSESDQDEYAKRKGYVTETQRVFLELGSLTEKTLLSESQDLKVALVYTEKDDPYSYEHVSDYVSALACGYTIINKDSVLQLPMNVSNLGEVKSVMLMTSDSTMKVNVKKACIAIEETSNISGDKLSNGWVNLPAETALISEEGTAMNTDGASLEQALTSTTRIVPINIAAQFSKVDRTDATVKVTVSYLDMNGASKSVSLEKTANDWNLNSEWILADGMKTAQYYKVEVFDKDNTNTAGVTVGSMCVSWYSYSGVYTSANYSGDTAISEGTPVSNSLLNTQLTGTLSTTDGNQKLTLESNHVNTGRTDYEKITLIGTGELCLSANLAGFPGDLEMYAYNTADGTSLFTEGKITAAAASETLTYTFAMPLNTGTSTIRYSLTVRSSSMGNSHASVIYIDVEPAVTLEGLVFGTDGSTKLTDFSAMVSAESHNLSSVSIKPGEKITVYARCVNDTNALQVTTTPSGTEGIQVSTLSGVAVQGYEGTWTKYELTMPTVTYETAGSFKLSSVKNANAAYTLSFVVSPGT